MSFVANLALDLVAMLHRTTCDIFAAQM